MRLRQISDSNDSENESADDEDDDIVVKKSDLNESLILKNTNKDMYVRDMNGRMECLLCEYRSNHMVNHYANNHQNAENYLARLPPEMAKIVVSKKKLEPAVKDNQTIKQLCLFCNETMSKTYVAWVSHLYAHTGEYSYRCQLCKKFSGRVQFTKAHNERCGTSHIEYVERPGRTFNMMGHVCSLCNFTQFDKDCVTRHLANQHSKSEKNGKIIAVPFLRIKESDGPRVRLKGTKLEAKKKAEEIKKLANEKKLKNAKKDKKKKQIVSSSSEFSSAEEENENEADTSIEEDPIKHEEESSKTEDEQSEVNETMPQLEKEDKGYNSDAFVARPKEVDCLFDKDTMRMMNDMSFNSGANPVTPPRPVATSIADKLNERFKSVQKDANSGNSESPGSSVASSPRKMLSFDVHLSEEQQKDQQRLLSEFEIKNDDIPIVNQPVEGIEAIPNSDSKPIATAPVVECVEDEDEWEDCSDDDDVDVNDQMLITKEEDDPLAVVKTSPKIPASPQTTTTTPIVTVNKNMLIEDTVNRLYMSIKPLQPSSVVLNEPKQVVVPPIITTPVTVPQPRTQFVASQRVKTINRIDNLGFSVWNNVYAFCCLINECGYESNRANICTHILEHNQQWTGYCYMCDLQVSSLVLFPRLWFQKIILKLFFNVNTDMLQYLENLFFHFL